MADGSIDEKTQGTSVCIALSAKVSLESRPIRVNTLAGMLGRFECPIRLRVQENLKTSK